jgi:hypothetical protein
MDKPSSDHFPPPSLLPPTAEAEFSAKDRKRENFHTAISHALCDILFDYFMYEIPYKKIVMSELILESPDKKSVGFMFSPRKSDPGETIHTEDAKDLKKVDKKSKAFLEEFFECLNKVIIKHGLAINLLIDKTRHLYTVETKSPHDLVRLVAELCEELELRTFDGPSGKLLLKHTQNFDNLTRLFLKKVGLDYQDERLCANPFLNPRVHLERLPAKTYLNPQHAFVEVSRRESRGHFSISLRQLKTLLADLKGFPPADGAGIYLFH